MFIIEILLYGLAFFIASKFLSGVHMKGYLSAVLVALIVAIINGLLGHYLEPIMSNSIIVNLIVSTIVIKIADNFTSGFRTDGWLPALYLAILVAVLAWFIPFI